MNVITSLQELYHVKSKQGHFKIEAINNEVIAVGIALLLFSIRSAIWF